MENFKVKNFNLNELQSISSKNIEEHLKLYKGYVTNANLILNKIKDYENNKEENSYAISELHRRFAFEYDGMKNHECYFSILSDGDKDLNQKSILKEKLDTQYSSVDNFIEKFKTLAMTRGVGWAMLYYDKEHSIFLTQWVEEQHLGHLATLSPIIALDMWEHSYVYDYPTSEKKKYIDVFFENLNWNKVEENFNKTL